MTNRIICRVIGSDGQPVATDVQGWITRALYADRVHVLFLLDICIADLVVERDPALVRANHVWIIGAANVRQAFDGVFTSAVTETVNALADSEVDIDPTLPYAPMSAVVDAIRRTLDNLSIASGSYQQNMITATADPRDDTDELFSESRVPANP